LGELGVSKEVILYPVSYATAETYMNTPRSEQVARHCVNLYLDPARGEIICLDNGVVIAERMPSLSGEYNKTRVSQKPVSKKKQPKFISTHGNISPATARKILTKYMEGEPVKKIAEELGVRVGAIYDIVKSNIRTRRKPHRTYRKLTKKELEEITHELESGMPIYEVARKHHRSTGYIEYLIRKYKIKYTPRKHRKKHKTTVSS